MLVVVEGGERAEGIEPADDRDVGRIPVHARVRVVQARQHVDRELQLRVRGAAGAGAEQLFRRMEKQVVKGDARVEGEGVADLERLAAGAGQGEVRAVGGGVDQGAEPGRIERAVHVVDQLVDVVIDGVDVEGEHRRILRGQHDVAALVAGVDRESRAAQRRVDFRRERGAAGAARRDRELRRGGPARVHGDLDVRVVVGARVAVVERGIRNRVRGAQAKRRLLPGGEAERALRLGVRGGDLDRGGRPRRIERDDAAAQAALILPPSAVASIAAFRSATSSAALAFGFAPGEGLGHVERLLGHRAVALRDADGECPRYCRRRWCRCRWPCPGPRAPAGTRPGWRRIRSCRAQGRGSARSPEPAARRRPTAGT